MKLFKDLRARFWKLVYDRTGSPKALGRYRTLAHVVRQEDKRFTVLNLQKADLASSLHRGARVAHVVQTVVTRPVKIDLVGDQVFLAPELNGTASSSAAIEGMLGR